MGPPPDDAGSLAVLGNTGPAIWSVGDNKPIETFDAAAGAAALAVDADRGILWVVGVEAVSAHGADGVELFRTELDLPDDLEDDEPRHVAVVPADGSVWVSAGRFLVSVAVDGTVLLEVERKRNVVDLVVDGMAGELWVADADSVEALDVATGTSLRRLELPEVTSEPALAGQVEPTALAFVAARLDEVTGEEQEPARLWVGSASRLLRYVLPSDDEDETSEPWLEIEARLPSDAPISRLVADSADGAWFLGGTHLGRWTPLPPSSDAPFPGRITLQIPFRPETTELTALAYDPGSRSVWVAGGPQLARVGLSGWALGRRHQFSSSIRDLAVVSTVVDDVAPELMIESPRPGEEVSDNRPEIRFAYSDEQSGVLEGSLELVLDGAPIDARCSYFAEFATCRPVEPLEEGVHTVEATVADVFRNRSAPASTTFEVTTENIDGGGGTSYDGPAYTPVSTPRGFLPNRPFIFGEIDTVDTASGNVTLRIPLGQVYEVGPTIRYRIQAVQNGHAWDQIQSGCPESGCTDTIRPYTFALTNPASNAGVGWEIHLGKLYPQDMPPELNDTTYDWQRWPNRGQDVSDNNKRWIYVAPDGARHDLLPLPGRDLDDGTLPVRYASDGSFLRLRQIDSNTAHVEFPDGRISVFEKTNSLLGTDFCGNGVSGCWRFSETRDRYGNNMSVTYGWNVDADEVWTIEDSTGRQHRITFSHDNADTLGGDGSLAPPEHRTSDGDEWGDLRKVVTKVEVAAFGGTMATYDFTYGEQTFVRGCPHETFKISETYNTLRGPALTKITVPESRPYEFVTASGSGVCGKSGGRVTEVTLPTRGKLAYTYNDTEWPIPTRCNYSKDADSTAAKVLVVPGLKKKERKDPSGTVESVWEYDSNIFPGESELVGGGADCSRAKYRITTVKSPENKDGKRVVTKHYHSVYQGPADPISSSTDGDQWQVTDHGLPYSKDFTLEGLDDTLFLSQETFLCDAAGSNCGGVKRSIYRRYASEFRGCYKGPLSDGDSPGCFQINPFQVAERIVYHDDDPAEEATETEPAVQRYVERRSQQWDGAGHLAVQLVTDNFDGAHQRSTTTEYTVTGQNLAIDATSGYVDRGDPATFLPDPDLADSEPWILTPYDKTTVVENGRTYVEETRFDGKGSPRCRRTFRGGARSAKDRVVLLDRGTTVGTDAGLPTKEIVMGGDFADLATGLPCPDRAKSPTTDGRKYVFDHTYVDLQLASTRIAGFPYRYRADIDQNTGLPKKVYEPTDEARTLTFDQLARLTKIDPDASLDEADTIYVYANPADADPTMTMRRRNHSDNTLLEEVTVFDHFGRSTEEKRTMPNPNSQSGSYVSLRKTTYDGAGHVTSQTTLQREGQVTDSDARRFSSFDAFGRPRTITEADDRVETREYLGDRSTTSTVKVQTTDGLADRSVTTLRDAQGRVVSTATSEHTTTFTYDPHGRQVSASRVVDSTTDPDTVQIRTWGYLYL